jgi:WD40 repeat protein
LNRRQVLVRAVATATACALPLCPARAATVGLPFIVLSDDQTTVAGATDGALVFRRLDNGPLPDPVPAHQGRVTALARLPDSWFFSGGEDGALRLWKPARAKPVHELAAGLPPVTALAVSDAIGGVAAGFGDGRIRVWIGSGIVDGTPLVFSGHQGAVTGLAFSSDQKTVISGGADATIRRTHLIEGSVTTHETEGPVSHLVGVFDGDHVAAIGLGEIAVFQANGAERLTLRAFAGPSGALAVSPDGDWVAVLDTSGRAFVFDRLGGRPYWSDGPGSGEALAMTFHPDSQRLLLELSSGALAIRDVRTGARL